ncbi:hypothetical protein [Lutimonas vermicola]|uniref:Uncharacterized protein n=1 Tax=Lutimonas vermicola TaxID=414288 RepID=A0ABU9KZG6_9FLAO
MESFYQIILSPDYRKNPKKDAEQILSEFAIGSIAAFWKRQRIMAFWA